MPITSRLSFGVKWHFWVAMNIRQSNPGINARAAAAVRRNKTLLLFALDFHVLHDTQLKMRFLAGWSMPKLDSTEWMILIQVRSLNAQLHWQQRMPAMGTGGARICETRCVRLTCSYHSLYHYNYSDILYKKLWKILRTGG